MTWGTRDQWEAWSRIVSSFAMILIPVVIAIVGWRVQSALADQSLRKDYLQIAIPILREEPKLVDPELRRWAVEVFRTSSPVELQPSLVNQLINASLRYMPYGLPFVEPDRVALEPPRSIQPLDLSKYKASGTEKDRGVQIAALSAVNAENFENCLRDQKKLVYLQKYVELMRNASMTSSKESRDLSQLPPLPK